MPTTEEVSRQSFVSDSTKEQASVYAARDETQSVKENTSTHTKLMSSCVVTYITFTQVNMYCLHVSVI